MDTCPISPIRDCARDQESSWVNIYNTFISISHRPAIYHQLSVDADKVKELNPEKDLY